MIEQAVIATSSVKNHRVVVASGSPWLRDGSRPPELSKRSLEWMRRSCATATASPWLNGPTRRPTSFRKSEPDEGSSHSGRLMRIVYSEGNAAAFHYYRDAAKAVARHRRAWEKACVSPAMVIAATFRIDESLDSDSYGHARRTSLPGETQSSGLLERRIATIETEMKSSASPGCHEGDVARMAQRGNESNRSEDC